LKKQEIYLAIESLNRDFEFKMEHGSHLPTVAKAIARFHNIVRQ
jgi:hypothetical protein